MKKYTIAVILAVIALAIAFFAFFPHAPSSNAPEAPGVTASLLYNSAAHGFSFSFPDNYAVSEQTSTAADSIMLINKMNLPLAQNSELPPVITIDVFQKATSTPLAKWLADNNQFSNFTLPGTVARATTIAHGLPAIGYIWQGLYQGLSIALENGTSVIILTGTYNSPSDQIVKDFEGVAASFTMQG